MSLESYFPCVWPLCFSVFSGAVVVQHQDLLYCGCINLSRAGFYPNENREIMCV